MTDTGRLASQARAIAEAGIAETETEAEYYVRDLNAAGYSIVRTAAIEAEALPSEERIAEALFRASCFTEDSPYADIKHQEMREFAAVLRAELVIGPKETPALAEDVRWGNLRKQPIGTELIVGPKEMS